MNSAVITVNLLIVYRVIHGVSFSLIAFIFVKIITDHSVICESVILSVVVFSHDWLVGRHQFLRTVRLQLNTLVQPLKFRLDLTHA